MNKQNMPADATGGGETLIEKLHYAAQCETRVEKRYRADLVNYRELTYVSLEFSVFMDVLAALRSAEGVIAEMNEALQAGSLFNPEMFGSMLRGNDNPILRWRDLLAALRSSSSGPQKKIEGVIAEMRKRASSSRDEGRRAALEYWADRLLAALLVSEQTSK